MSVIVLVELQVKPDAVNQMKSLLKEVLPDTRAYKGCQGIDIYSNTDDSSNLVFYERWEERKNYESYLAWRTETGLMDKLGTMLAAPPSIRYFERVDA
jgi:quinol monooxygenase YgiN